MERTLYTKSRFDEHSTKPREWDSRFLEMAELVSSWSHDPSTKIGAVFVDDRKKVLSTGYNGFPRGIHNHPERWSDRPTKYKYIVHGEANAIYNATWNGASLDGSTLYVHGLPTCSECAKAVIQVGAKRVVCHHPVDIPERWQAEWEETRSMFDEAGVAYSCQTYEPGKSELQLKLAVDSQYWP